MMTVSVLSDVDPVIVKVGGELNDSRDRTLLDEALADLSSRRVVMDLTLLTYINSMGISSILLAWRRAQREGGHLVLAGARGTVKEVLSLTRITSFIPFAETIEEAAQA